MPCIACAGSSLFIGCVQGVGGHGAANAETAFVHWMHPDTPGNLRVGCCRLQRRLAGALSKGPIARPAAPRCRTACGWSSRGRLAPSAHANAARSRRLVRLADDRRGSMPKAAVGRGHGCWAIACWGEGRAAAHRPQRRHAIPVRSGQHWRTRAHGKVGRQRGAWRIMGRKGRRKPFIERRLYLP